MILNETYQQLLQLGLVHSHNEFSKRWLNKSARYMSMLRATGREPSLDTLVRLLANLKLQYDSYRTCRVSVFQQRADDIKLILNQINKELLATAQARTVKDYF
ncbi:hypothetical protein N8000_05290 [Rhodospirillales bacterium]|nr:hypothetical protein [Rhodospirillales bacterium]